MTPDHQNEPPQFHIGIDCADPGSLAPFWAAALGYELGTPISDGVYLMLKPPDPSHPVVYFQKVPEAKAVKNRLHLDIRTPAAEELIDRLTSLGATRLGEPRSGSTCAWWQVMADPAGNEFCVCSAEC
ncbi:MAG: VOC family protein [Acidimicrobiales bacterium]|jgi:predicted enzyme related to lactoylglutathione lyase